MPVVGFAQVGGKDSTDQEVRRKHAGGLVYVPTWRHSNPLVQNHHFLTVRSVWKLGTKTLLVLLK